MEEGSFSLVGMVTCRQGCGWSAVAVADGPGRPAGRRGAVQTCVRCKMVRRRLFCSRAALANHGVVAISMLADVRGIRRCASRLVSVGAGAWCWCQVGVAAAHLFSRRVSMAPPSYASALTGDFLAVPPSPKRPREDEQPEVRRTAQSQAWPWPNRNDTINIRSVVVSLRLHSAQRNRGASALHLSKPFNNQLS
eukprot:scaffold754_cov130-Isochrysis_galbana.AAC.6